MPFERGLNASKASVQLLKFFEELQFPIESTEAGSENSKLVFFIPKMSHALEDFQ